MNTDIKKPVIVFDMDDVLIDLHTPWFKMLDLYHQTGVKAEDLKEWNLKNLFPQLTHEEIFEPLSNIDFWCYAVKPINGAVEYLLDLIKKGCDVYICTAGTPESIEYRWEYVIKEYFPFIDWKHIIISSNKNMIKCDVIVDDYDKNIINSDAMCKILLNKPYNRCKDEDIHVVENWDDIKKIIDCFLLSWENVYGHET